MLFINDLIKVISALRLNVTDEKITQQEIANAFLANAFMVNREHKLDANNIPDFFIDGIAIEVKIKGTARKIYKQCERYCQFDDVKQLMLITNRSMGFPATINGKPCYVLNLGKAWL